MPTGPDLTVDWGPDFDDESVVYDFTVVHATAPSNRGSSVQQLFDAVRGGKAKLYNDQVASNRQRFVVLAFSSHGAFCAETVAFIKRLAAVTGRTVGEIALDLRIALHKGNGATLAQAVRRILG